MLHGFISEYPSPLESGYLADRIGSNWDEWFGLLTLYKAREGHCYVPHRHVEEGLNLGTWVSIQRRNKDTMPAERRQRLDALGFVWRAK